MMGREPRTWSMAIIVKFPAVDRDHADQAAEHIMGRLQAQTQNDLHLRMLGVEIGMRTSPHLKVL